MAGSGHDPGPGAGNVLRRANEAPVEAETPAPSQLSLPSRLPTVPLVRVPRRELAVRAVPESGPVLHGANLCCLSFKHH